MEIDKLSASFSKLYIIESIKTIIVSIMAFIDNSNVIGTFNFIKLIRSSKNNLKLILPINIPTIKATPPLLMFHKITSYQFVLVIPSKEYNPISFYVFL